MQRLMKTVFATIGLIMVCLASTASAHHAFAAEFDREKPIALRGRVTEMRWANPHAWIYIDVTNEDGTVVNWALETRAANNLIRLGWRREDLPPGTELVVEAFRARNGTPTASIDSVTFADGRSLFVGSPDQPQP